VGAVSSPALKYQYSQAQLQLKTQQGTPADTKDTIFSKHKQNKTTKEELVQSKTSLKKRKEWSFLPVQ